MLTENKSAQGILCYVFDNKYLRPTLWRELICFVHSHHAGLCRTKTKTLNKLSELYHLYQKPLINKIFSMYISQENKRVSSIENSVGDRTYICHPLSCLAADNRGSPPIRTRREPNILKWFLLFRISTDFSHYCDFIVGIV